MKLSKQMLRFSFLLGFCLCSTSYNAQAQSCTDSALNSLAGCATASAENCSLASPSCQRLDVVQTLEDAKEDASKKCCGLGNSRRRRACLQRIENKYRSAGARSRGLPVRDLIDSNRVAIQTLRRSDCGNGLYKDLF
jgi:hypothetical protein